MYLETNHVLKGMQVQVIFQKSSVRYVRYPFTVLQLLEYYAHGFVGQNFASDAQGFPRHVVHFRRYLQIDAHKYTTTSIKIINVFKCFPFRFKSNKLMWNGTVSY